MREQWQDRDMQRLHQDRERCQAIVAEVASVSARATGDEKRPKKHNNMSNVPSFLWRKKRRRVVQIESKRERGGEASPFAASEMSRFPSLGEPRAERDFLITSSKQLKKRLV